jgi:hypothetical protein
VGIGDPPQSLGHRVRWHMPRVRDDCTVPNGRRTSSDMRHRRLRISLVGMRGLRGRTGVLIDSWYHDTLLLQFRPIAELEAASVRVRSHRRG